MPKDPIKTLENIEKGLEKKVATILNTIAFKIRARVASQEFIHWKSKRQPIIVEKAKLVGQMLQVTVRGASHWTWASALIGPPGATTIKSKKASGMLAIPTDFARGPHAGRMPGPTNKMWGQIQIFGGMIWGPYGGKRWEVSGKVGHGGRSEGARQRRAAGEIFKGGDLIPLFTLKGSVIVKRKVHPAELEAWGNQLLRAALIKGRIVKP